MDSKFLEKLNIEWHQLEIDHLFYIVANRYYTFLGSIDRTVDNKPEWLKSIIQLLNKQRFSERELIQEWKSLGSPTRFDEIYLMLHKKFRLTKDELRVATNIVANDDLKIMLLANEIISLPPEAKKQVETFLKLYS